MVWISQGPQHYTGQPVVDMKVNPYNLCSHRVDFDGFDTVDCARALLAVHNVEINVQNKLGDTPLHNAAWKGHAGVVQMLLEKGKL